MNIFCAHCGNGLSEKAKFCSVCGGKIEISSCPSCGKEIDYESAFCIHCGYALMALPKEAPISESILNQKIVTEDSAPPLLQRVPSQEELPSQSLEQFAPTFDSPSSDYQTLDADVDLGKIVSTNTSYYLPEFEKVKREEKTRFNWAAFFFGAAFCYYRKSKELYWHFFKALYILIASSMVAGTVIALVVSTMFPSALLGYGIVALLAGGAINIYGLICAIRCGQQFNTKYYRHCLETAARPNILEKGIGTSLASGVLFNLTAGVCFSVLSAICGTVISVALFGGMFSSIPVFSDWTDSFQMIDPNKQIMEQDLHGYWSFIGGSDATTTISRETLAAEGASEEEIAEMLSALYIKFYDDGSFLYAASDAENPVKGSWTLLDNELYLLAESTPDIATSIQNGILSIVSDGVTLRFERTSTSTDVSTPPNVPKQSPGISFNDGISTSKDYSWIEGTYSTDPQSPAVSMVLELSFDTPRPWEHGDDWYITFHVYDSYDILGTGKAYYEGGGERPTFHHYDSWYPDSEIQISSDGNCCRLTSEDGMFNDTPFFKDANAHDKIQIIGSDGSYYILPTNTEYISSYDLEGFDQVTVALIRNEIYARYGYNFKDEQIRAYFEGQSWYSPVSGLDASTFDMAVFNYYETENIKTILDYEREMGWRS